MEILKYFFHILLLFLLTKTSAGQGNVCYDSLGGAKECSPDFMNAALNKMVAATSTCGQSGPQEFCLPLGGSSCEHICDASQPGQGHSAEYMTDQSGFEPTWWQSESLNERQEDWLGGREHNVNVTISLGKAFDVTYIRIKFRSPRPESFAIYKRTSANGEWIPYQFYSASCPDTYSRPVKRFLFSTSKQDIAMCSDKYSDFMPLTGGVVSFATLDGRPDAYDYDNSKVLQDWVTATDIRIVLTRMNTFGDEIFGDPQVLKSYYYAIEDLTVGARCKCNGHAGSCGVDNVGNFVCNCEHNTMGPDCGVCKPFYNDRAWARATENDAMECLPCDCNGKSVECYFDDELYRITGHGGHCINCRDNFDGIRCKDCRPNFYIDEETQSCVPCSCDVTGSVSQRCNDHGQCPCIEGVTGQKCDVCTGGYYGFSDLGCKRCDCEPDGSMEKDQCDSTTGNCKCKKYVEGQRCDRCKYGYFGLSKDNPYGCIAWDSEKEHPTVCPDGYKTIGSMCYAVLPLKVNWPEAQSLCDTFGGDVLQINTDSTMSDVASLFNQAHSTAYWLDASDVMVPGTWKYHGREATTLTYTKWAQGQPTGTQGTRCAAVQPGTDTWVSLSCTDTAMVICQIELAHRDLVG